MKTIIALVAALNFSVSPVFAAPDRKLSKQEQMVQSMKSLSHAHVQKMDEFLGSSASREEVMEYLQAKVTEKHGQIMARLGEKKTAKMNNFPSLRDSLLALNKKYEGQTAEQILVTEVVQTQEIETSCVFTALIIDDAVSDMGNFTASDWMLLPVGMIIALPITVVVDILLLPFCAYHLIFTDWT